MARSPIRRRLSVAFVAGLALVLAGLSCFVYVRTGNNLLETVDAGLRSRAEVLRGDIQEHGLILPVVQPTLLENDEDFAQIVGPAGAIIRSSEIVTGAPLVRPGEVAALRGPALFDERVKGIDNVTRVLADPVRISGRPYVILVGVSLQDRRDQMLQLAGTLAISGSVLLLVGGLGAWWLVGAALRPVERMRRQAAAISTAEPSSRLSPSEGGDEIARLGLTLNEMLDRIAEAVGRERALVDRASHELRTPLAIQRMDLDLAQSGPQTVEELAAALRSASEENTHLTRLAENLLVLSRARHGQLLVRRRTTSLATLLSDAVDRNTPRAVAANVRLDGAADDASVHVDPDWLRQALDELLSNALSATSPSGRISIAGTVEGEDVQIAVEDTGSGFRVDFLPRAFDPFTQDPSGHRDATGAGLGLAIVKAVAEAHGGSVVASNTAQGAIVSLVLPAVGPSGPSVEPAPAAGTVAGSAQV